MTIPEPADCIAQIGISDADFAALAALLHRETGIFLSETRRAMVVSRLSRRLKALKLNDMGSYRRLLESHEGEQELDHMIESLTTNVTRFYREAAHFDYLKKEVFPNLADRAQRGGRVRLWSAGCSSGEEALCLAFSFLDNCPQAPELDVKILATDIDRNMILRALEGRYSELDLNTVPETVRKTHFLPDAVQQGMWTVDARARRLVAFKVLNLLKEWPFRGQFDVIMCRNVTIYFDEATQQALWQRFARRLPVGGTLMIGHSEQVARNMRDKFDARGTSVFHRKAEHVATTISQTAN